MGRQAKQVVTLADGRAIGYGFKIRDGRFVVQFQCPATTGKYVEKSTGILVPKGWTAVKNAPADAFNGAARIITGAYGSKPMPTAPQKMNWEQAEQKLRDEWGLRERSLEIYTSTIKILRDIISTDSPRDITVDRAKEFKKVYQNGTFSRSKKEGAKQYPRAPKTVENALRRLNGLWGYFEEFKIVASNPWADIERPTLPDIIPRIPGEETFTRFMAWLDNLYPDWPLPKAFLEIKGMAVCRVQDLCSVKARDLDTKNLTITIRSEYDKTHAERLVPLPADLVATLARLRGKEWLWERYVDGAKIHRPGPRNSDKFTPSLLYWFILDLFRKWNREHPDEPVSSHDLRKRGLTLLVEQTGSIDRVADAVKVSAATIMKHYLDKKRAFEGQELLKEGVAVLRFHSAPKTASSQPVESGDQ